MAAVPPSLLLAWALAPAAVLAAAPHRAPSPPLPDPLNEATRLLSPEVAARLVAAAVEQTRRAVRYDGSYRRIPYPLGDVPESLGVCTDVVIRSYRAIGVDLQKEVHEDMSRAFDLYPRRWGRRAPDANIDHRRVPNLEVFFARRGVEVAAPRRPEAYLPGDLVTWSVGDGLPHIGIVTDQKAPDGRTPLVVHNIGAGPKIEDVLFGFPLTGHFRYAGPRGGR